MTSIVRKNLAGDYALTLSWRYAEVEFLGLPKLKDERVFRLEHIYVPLRLCRDWANRFDRQKTMYVPKVLQEQRHLVVLGDPGSGKSTLVKLLTYAFGEAGSNAYKRACGELIPIPIILRDYKTRQWKNYEDMLRDFIATLDEDIRSEITTEWLLEYLREGKAILLIDGLDEVGSREERLRLRNKIIFPILRQSRPSYTILTSRIVGYEEVPFHSMAIEEEVAVTDASPSFEMREPLYRFYSVTPFYVAPFDDEEIAQFITRWHQLRETFPDKQRDGVDSLLRALDQNDRVKRLAHNPQLLTLIALIHRVTANLPSGRVELYNKIVEAYLETIQVYRKLGTPAKLDEMKRWLAKVGWEMQVRRDEEIKNKRWWSKQDDAKWLSKQDDDLLVSREEIKQWLIEAIAKERGQVGATEQADQFLDYVAKRSGLLVPRGPEKFAFAHLTFQEYFAAFELRGRVRQFDELAEICAGLADERLWHETLNLLFEMLTEFPGADDDLFDEIAARAAADEEMRDGAAKLFSSLLLDEQSGLSVAKQHEAAAFALTAVCDRYDKGVVKDLQSLSFDQRNQLVHPWFAHRLREAGQIDFGKYFFINGDELLADWPVQLSQWVTSPAYRRPSELQVAEIVLIGAGDEENYHQICPWAVEHLPLKLWLQRISRAFGDAGELTLADLYRRALYSTSTNAPRYLLLLELSISLAITKSQILRTVLAIIARSLTPEDGPSESPYDGDRESARYMDDWRNEVLNHARRRAANHASKRVLPRDLARVLGLNLAEDGDWGTQRELAHALAREAAATEQPLLGSTTRNARSNVLIAAERALFVPNAATPHLTVELQSLLCSQDDWSRLLASSALLTLGEGTPDLCRERNALLVKGIEQSPQFTFPSGLHTETQREEFSQQLPELFDLVFLQAPSHPWLRPKFFDPVSSESKYFLSPPHEFFALAAEVLDPEGKTELAKWREP